MSFTSTEEALLRELLDQQAAILSLAENESTITSKLSATKATLSDLTLASTLADTDLLVVRQGTTDKATSGATLKAFSTPASASTTTSGIVELATATETTAGTDTTRAVTPAGLAALTATETRAGLVELATSAEAIAGTDTTRAVTPAGLAGKFSDLSLGTMSEQAANAVNITGGSINGAVIGGATPASGKFTTMQATTLSDGTNSTSSTNCIQGSAKAWCLFNGTTSTILGNYNVSSVTVLGTGIYKFNFTNAMANANFGTSIGWARDSGGGYTCVGMLDQNNPQSASNVTMVVGAGASALNVARVCISVFD